jgi:hypothetical protein
VGRQAGFRTGSWFGDEGGESRRIGGAVEAPLSIVAAPLGSGFKVAKTALGTCIVVVVVVVVSRFFAASSFSSVAGIIKLFLSVLQKNKLECLSMAGILHSV